MIGAYQIFLILCVVTISVVFLFTKRRVEAIIIGVLGIVFGFMLEIYGISGGGWNYDAINSVFVIFNVPIEILMGYFTGSFLVTSVIFGIYNISDEPERHKLLTYALPTIGLIMLFISIPHSNFVPLMVPLSFLAFWGLLLSKKDDVVILVGLLTFFADFIVEWLLTSTQEYYTNGWEFGIALTFMFAAIFVTGVLTSGKLQFVMGQKSSRHVFMFEEPPIK